MKPSLTDKIQTLSENRLEGKGGWISFPGGMYRPKGKTWPSVTLKGSEVMVRDDNGKRPSQAYTTQDLTANGVMQLIKSHISQPWPTIDLIEFMLK